MPGSPPSSVGPEPASVAFTSAEQALVADEYARTRDFLWVSGGLGVLGGVAALFLGGTPASRTFFLLSVGLLVVSYLGFGLHIRRPEQYSPNKALMVVTVSNLAGIGAAVHFGVFSPAPMVLMVPIAYFGLSNSGAAAGVASGVMAVALVVPSMLMAIGLVPDPGLIQAADLPIWKRVAYVLLVQLVLLCAFVLARTSRRSTRTAVRRLEEALRGRDVAKAQVQEAHALLAEARATGAAGPLSGERLGSWTLGLLIGRGASSEVYEAVGADDDTLRAVKVLRPELVEGEVSRMLLEREVSVMLGLASPHVVRLHDYSLGDRPFLVMEYLQGEDLGQRLRSRGALSPAEVVVMIREVAEGLSTAHRSAVIHRDVKPSNVFAHRSAQGSEQWKVLDFGVAAVQGAASSLTAGFMLGTPGYMSPEQLRSGPIGVGVDVFSLACVAYRALTGRPAFAGSNVHACMMAVLSTNPPRPSTLSPVLGTVDDVLAVGMAKQARDRFADVGSFATALARAVQGERDPALAQRAQAVLAQLDWDAQVGDPDETAALPR